MQRDQSGRLLRRRRHRRQDSAERALRAGHGDPELVPDAEHHQRAGRPGVQPRSDVSPRRSSSAISRSSAIDYQPFTNLRGSFKFFEYQQPADPIQGILGGLERHARRQLRHLGARGQRQLDRSTTRRSPSSPGARTITIRKAARSRGAGPNFCRSALPVNAIANRNTAGFGAIPVHLPERDAPRSQHVRLRRDLALGHDDLGRRARPGRAVVHVGRPHRELSAEQHRARSATSSSTRARATPTSASTRLMGRHTAKVGYYYYKSLQRRGEGAVQRHHQLQNDEANNPLDTSFPFANAAIGTFTQYQPAVALGGGRLHRHQPRGLHPGQLEGQVRTSRSTTASGSCTRCRSTTRICRRRTSSREDVESRRRRPRSTSPAAPTARRPARGTNRQAMNPITGQFLGTNSALAIGTLVPGTGNSTNGIQIPGRGHRQDAPDLSRRWRSRRASARRGTSPASSVHRARRRRALLRSSAGLAERLRHVAEPAVHAQRHAALRQASGSRQQPGCATEAAPALTVWQYDMPLPTSMQWNIGAQFAVPFNDRRRRLVHRPAQLQHAQRRQHQQHRPGIGVPVAVRGSDAGHADAGQLVCLDAAQPDPLLPAATRRSPSSNRSAGAPTTRFSSPITRRLQERLRVRIQRHLPVERQAVRGAAAAAQRRMAPSPSATIRPPRRNSSATTSRRRTSCGRTSPGILPDLKQPSGIGRAIGLVVNDWSLSGIWNGQSGAPYNADFTYQSGGGNVNLTGSPDYAARVLVLGDTGSGCDANPLKQFNTAAFKGPAAGSVGLESGIELPAGLFRELDGSGHCPDHPAGRRPLHPAPNGHLQRVQSGGDHQSQQLDDAGRARPIPSPS